MMYKDNIYGINIVYESDSCLKNIECATYETRSIIRRVEQDYKEGKINNRTYSYKNDLIKSNLEIISNFSRWIASEKKNSQIPSGE